MPVRLNPQFRMRGALLPLLALLLALALVAGCSRTGIHPDRGIEGAPGSVDMIFESWKDGQFVVGGGVITAADLDGHLAWLQSQGRLPESVLLQASNESRVRGMHLREFARLQARYGFRAYVEHKGRIEPLQDEP